jgi:hypothetical protein
MGQSSFLGQHAHLVRNTNGARLASAIVAETFVSGSSSDVGSSDGDDSEVGEISNKEVRKPSTQMISEIY